MINLSVGIFTIDTLILSFLYPPITFNIIVIIFIVIIIISSIVNTNVIITFFLTDLLIGI